MTLTCWPSSCSSRFLRRSSWRICAALHLELALRDPRRLPVDHEQLALVRDGGASGGDGLDRVGDGAIDLTAQVHAVRDLRERRRVEDDLDRVRIAALVLLDQELGEVLLLALELGLLGLEPGGRGADLAPQHVQVPADLVVALRQELDARVELPHLRANTRVLRLLLLEQRVSGRGAREDETRTEEAQSQRRASATIANVTHTSLLASANIRKLERGSRVWRVAPTRSACRSPSPVIPARVRSAR